MKRIGAAAVTLGSWAKLHEPATRIRFAVFVREQNVPPEIELDEWDELSLHALAVNAADEAVGTGRLLPDGHIGRMAVVPTARGLGVGGALLHALIAAGRERGLRQFLLNAQTQALPFYRRFGFVQEGDEFFEAGIAHRAMRLVLSPESATQNPAR